MRHCNSLWSFRVWLFFLSISVIAPCAAAGELTCATKSIRFSDPFAGWQLLVSEGERDVTRVAQYKSGNPAVALVDTKGYVTPKGDGTTTISIRYGGNQCEVPVQVSGVNAGRVVDFQREIVPLFSRLGCNAGGCHGK